VLTFSSSVRSAGEHEETELREDANLTVGALLDTAVERYPEYGLLAAGRARANAEMQYGERWFPDTMELGGYYLSDRQLDDTGLYEAEVAVSMPLWMPGEKRAQATLGEAMTSSQASQADEMRWMVAGQLRRQLWQTTLARQQWKLALEQEERLAGLLEQVVRLTEAGELSRADELATMQELAVWKAETLALEAAYQDSVREYRALVGTEVFPADISEKISSKEHIDDDHPALRTALDELASTEAALALVHESTGARPSVQVFWRELRANRMEPDHKALGVGLAVPLGRSPRKGPQIARASEDRARAEARLLSLRRELGLQLHEARHVLKTLDLQLENSNRMMEAAAERHRLDQLAFELGEFSLREWLRRLNETRRIERDHQLLQIRQEAAVASYNQAVGDMP
jgi:outer membrane protein TolC